MRILMVCADWGIPFGGDAGSSVHFRCLANALSSLGHQVRIIVSNASGPAACGLPVDVVPYRRFWPALQGVVEQLRVHSTEAMPLPATPTTDAAGLSPPQLPRKSQVSSWMSRVYYQELPRFLDRAEEIVFHRRRFEQSVARVLASFSPDGVYERYALGQTGAARAVRAAGGRSIPHLLEVNASLAAERAERGELGGLWGWWNRLEEGRQWRRADGVMCVSDALRDMVVSAGTDADRVVVTPNGVDVDLFSPECPKGALKRQLGSQDRDVLVGWLGSLSPGRGAEEFLRIMSLVLPQVPEARGVVIGDGNLADDLRRLADELGLADRVAFVGAVRHAYVPGLLVDLDVAVASYPMKEGFYFSPMKVSEYMACGLAVVCGRAGQMQQLVEDGRNGVLVEPGFLPDWGQAVIALCRDPELRARLGQAARESALVGPTWVKNASLVADGIRALRCKDLRMC